MEKKETLCIDIEDAVCMLASNMHISPLIIDMREKLHPKSTPFMQQAELYVGGNYESIVITLVSPWSLTVHILYTFS